MINHMDSFRMDTAPDRDTGQALPDAHDRDSVPVNDR